MILVLFQACLPPPASLSPLHRYVPIALPDLSGQLIIVGWRIIGTYLALFSVGMIGTGTGLFNVIKVRPSFSHFKGALY